MRTILPKYALCPLKHNSCPPQNDPLKRKMITLFLGLMCDPIVDTYGLFLMVIGYFCICFVSLHFAGNTLLWMVKYW